MTSTGTTSAGNVLPLRIETDDNDIAGGSNVQIVICLNYVWDAVNTKWVRMTQP